MPWSFLLKTTTASSSFSSFSLATYFKCLGKSSASTAAPLNSSIIFLWPPALNLSYSWFPSRLCRALLWPMAPAAVFPAPVPSQPVHHTSAMPLSSSPCSSPSSTTEMPLLCNSVRDIPLFLTHPFWKHIILCWLVLLQPSLFRYDIAIQTRPSIAKTMQCYHVLATWELQACIYNSLFKSHWRQQHSSCLAQCQPNSRLQLLIKCRGLQRSVITLLILQMEWCYIFQPRDPSLM